MRVAPGLALLLTAAAALAQEPAPPRAEAPAPPSYEEELIGRALAATGLEREPQPAGKLLERIEIVREEVIGSGDPWPSLLNALHVTTRDPVVRQELLVAPGEPWDQARVEESARNLRQLSILALVRTVACKGSAPGRVVLLVVTRDLWSIRLNSAFTVVGQVAQVLDLYPAETNLLGWGKSIALHLRAQQVDLGALAVRDKAALGALWVDPRLLGSRVALTASLDLLLAGVLPCAGRRADGSTWCSPRRPGELDGFTAQLHLSRPLWSLAAEWAFSLGGSANVRQVRRFVTNAAASPAGPQGLSIDVLTFDDASVPAEQRVYLPRVYDVSELAALATAVRSLGRETKHDLTVGVGGYRLRYTVPGSFPFDAALVARYAAEAVPRSEDTLYALAGWRTRGTRYASLHDLQAFALTEDYLLGPDVGLTLRAAATPGQPRQAFADASFAARVRWYEADDLLTLFLNAGARWQPRLGEIGRPGPFANNYLEAGVRNASPPAWGARLHLQARLVLRDNSLGQDLSSLGGDTGLRGFSSGAFAGANLAQLNVEVRTRPVNLRSLHLGMVAFADGGSVFGGQDPRNPAQALAFQWHQSIGLGLRAQFPQFDKQPLRVDFGVPLGGGAGVGTWFSLSFAQAF